MANKDDYAVFVQPLPKKDGGGFMAIVPDLPGCTSDGESWTEAIKNVEDAIESWMEAAKENGRPIPEPNSTIGKWLQRVPKSLHLALKRLAENEGVSFNQYVTTVLAEQVGRRTE